MVDTALRPQLAKPFSMRGSLARDLGVAGLWGASWGVAARLWMRFISTEPEFSVTGSAYIIGAPILIGLASVLATRSSGFRPALRWPARGLAGLSTLLLGMAAGILMLPTIALGAIGYGGRGWPRALRVAVMVLAALPVVVVHGEIEKAPPSHRVGGLLAYLALVVAIIPLYSRIYHPALLSKRGTANV